MRIATVSVDSGPNFFLQNNGEPQRVSGSIKKAQRPWKVWEGLRLLEGTKRLQKASEGKTD